MSANWTFSTMHKAAIVALLLSEMVMALPAELSTLRPLGEGNLRWFGFKLYDATLYTPAGQPFGWEQPFALSLRYAREIPGQKIVEASVTEMVRYGMPDERRAGWTRVMQQAFPDVRAGDEIVGAFDGRSTRFWHNGRPSGQVDDPLFGRLFFRIWLDPASRAPALRSQLLGAAR